MDTILLVSSGLGAIRKFVGRDPKELRLLFIPTAGNTSSDAWWVRKDRKSLTELGFQMRELDIAGQPAEAVHKALGDCDVVFVAGGNTFYLLDAMQRCGFKAAIEAFLKRGGQYAGGSAGAIVAGPDIEPIRSLDKHEDAPGLQSTRALGLVDFVVIPHVNLADGEHDDRIKAIKRDFGTHFTLVPINDEQAITVTADGNYQIIASSQV